MSATDSIGYSRKKQHFSPAYDLSYRFQTPEPFNRQRKISRPHTTPGISPEVAYRSGRYKKSYLTTVAAAQLASAEALHYSLGDGILMLRQGHKYVFPSIFAQLDKMYLRVSTPLGTTAPFTAPPGSRRWSQQSGRDVARVYVDDTNAPSLPHAAETRPTTSAGKIAVEFLKKVDREEKSAHKIYIPHSDYYSKRTEEDDRCPRSSDFPEIQIDGRSLGQNIATGDGHMSRQHCDVLGPLSCPDCIRTRAQNSHLRMCNATTAANATDTYKLALIHERIPQLSIREIQRKVYDGEISDSVNPVSKWKEIKNCQTPTLKEENDAATTVDIHDKTRAKLKSSGSMRSQVFETILESPEATENNSTKTSEMQKQEPPDVSGSMEVMGIENGGNADKSIEMSDFKPEDSVTAPATASSERSPRKRVAKKRKSAKRTSRVFNRDLIPSPNYFNNVSDLMERVRKLRRYRKGNPWDVDISRTYPPPDVTLPDSAKQEHAKDDTSSISSQESVSPRKKDSLKTFEPPVMYDRKARYLGPRTVSAE